MELATQEKIQELLNKLRGGTMLNYHYDFLTHQMRFSVMVTLDTHGHYTLYQVVIDEIYSIIFHDNDVAESARTGASRDGTGYVWNMMQITSFHYSPDLAYKYQIASTSEDEVKVIRNGACNLLLEIWNTEVYMIARRLTINDTLLEDNNTFKLL